MAVVGGSVAAGVGSWRTTAWPHVLQRLLEPVFSRLGMVFELRNQAMPNRPEFPDNHCLNPVVGNDADVILREWRSYDWDHCIPSSPTVRLLESRRKEEWVWNQQFASMADISGSKRSRRRQLIHTKDLAGFEAFVRSLLGLKSQPLLHFVALDADAGDNSSAFRGALNRGGILYEAYKHYCINFFSAFGPPFDHFRKRLQHNHLNNDSCTNLASCVVSAEKPDGHHRQAQSLGFARDDHPQWIKYSKHNLFVDGRPGILGHEVMGHQLAYYYLLILNTSLTSVLTSVLTPAGHTQPRNSGGGSHGYSHPAEAVSVIEDVNLGYAEHGHRHLPRPVICQGFLCPRNGPPVRCAYSSLPKRGPLDIGDIISNSTAVTRWQNVAVDDRRIHCNSDQTTWCTSTKYEDTEDCFEVHTDCSHAIVQTRAFEGFAGSGALQLDIDFSRGSQCAIVISEPQWVLRCELAA